MTETLRPNDLGGTLDRGVQILRAQPVLFIGLAAIPGLVQFVAQMAGAVTQSSHGAVYLVCALVLLVAELASAALQGVSSAAICYSASRVNLGERTTIGEALSTFTPWMWRLFGLAFLQALFAGWPLIIVAFVVAIVGELGASLAVTIPIWILGAIPCIALYVRYALSFPCCAIEGLTATSSLDRAKDLSEGGRLRICGGILVPMVPSFLLSFGGGQLFDALRAHGVLFANNPTIEAAVKAGISLPASLVFGSYSAIVLTLLYYDQRIRKEGFDLEHLMQTAGMSGTLGLSIAAPVEPGATQEGEA